MYGCNMRTLVDILRFGPKTHEEHINRKLSDLPVVDLNSLLKFDANNAGNVTHNLIVSGCPSQPELGTLDALAGDNLQHMVASRAVWKNLIRVRGKKVYLELRNMTDMFLRVPGMASCAGWLWESICHNTISEGGKFTLKKMAETGQGKNRKLVRSSQDHGTSITFAPLEPYVFTPSELLSSTSDPRKYFIPRAGNNPAFDAFLRINEDIGVGLQMTLAAGHTLNARGLRMLWGRLGKKSADKNYFVFVIRQGSDFECKRPSATQMNRFKFYTLELPLSHCECDFPWLASISADGVAVIDPDAVEMDRGAPYELPDDDEVDMKDDDDEEEEEEDVFVNTDEANQEDANMADCT